MIKRISALYWLMQSYLHKGRVQSKLNWVFQTLFTTKNFLNNYVTRSGKKNWKIDKILWQIFTNSYKTKIHLLLVICIKIKNNENNNFISMILACYIILPFCNSMPLTNNILFLIYICQIQLYTDIHRNTCFQLHPNFSYLLRWIHLLKHLLFVAVWSTVLL